MFPPRDLVTETSDSGVNSSLGIRLRGRVSPDLPLLAFYWGLVFYYIISPNLCVLICKMANDTHRVGWRGG